MPLTRIKNTAIGDGGITTAKLADGSVTTVKVADSAVNSAKIGVDVIAAEDLAANSVTVSEISDGAVTSAKLATQTGNVDFADNGRIRLGDSQDLQIYHDGGNSRIVDAGTGNLNLQADNNINILNNAGTEFKAQFITDGAVNLFYDNSKKFETTTTGVDVTGDLTADGLTVDTDAYRRLLLTYPDAFTSKLQVGYSNFYVQGSATNDRLTIANNSSGQTHFENQSKTSMVIDNSGDISFYEDTGTTAKLFWDASAEALGIGTTLPSQALHIANSGFAYARMQSTGYGGTGFDIGQHTGGNIYLNNRDNTSIILQTNNTQRMLLDSNGALGIRTSSIDANYQVQILDTGVDGRHGLKVVQASTATRQQVGFANPNGVVGTITTTSSSTAYNTSSDYRLKENVEYEFDASTRLKQLKPARFNFIADADSTVDGFLAHEVQDVVPEAITGDKDAMRDEEYEVTPAVIDEDGNVVTPAVMGTRSVPEYQGIDQSKLVPLLVKSLQEALTEIDTLKAEVAALKNA